MKEVYIIHGWGDNPDEHWLPWLRQKLESEGFRVIVPAMPDPDHPKIAEWVNFLLHLAPDPTKNTFFVGHSIGCQAILRYIERLPEGTRVGGVVLVGGWFQLIGPDEEEEKIIVRPWLEEPVNFDLIKSRIGKVTAIFSDDDPFVPLDNKAIFEHSLGAKALIEHNKGHFTRGDSVIELPSVLSEILEMAGGK